MSRRWYFVDAASALIQDRCARIIARGIGAVKITPFSTGNLGFLTRLSLEDGLYAGVLLLLLLPIWTNAHFPTQDGPMHLHNARILLDHALGKGQIYDAYYQPNLTLFPYWFSHVALALLLTVFSPAIAEKLFLTSYIVLMALLVRMLLRALRPGASFLSFLALPLICAQPFQMGFLAFCFSYVFVLLIVLLWIRYQEKLTTLRLLVLSTLFLLLYFSHPVSYVLALVVVASLIAAERTAVIARLSAVVLAALPSLVLLAAYLIAAPSYQGPRGVPYATLADNFALQTSLVLLTNREAPLAIAVSVFFVILAVLTVRTRLLESSVIERSDAFLAAAVIGLAIHLYGAHNLVGFFERTQTFPLFMLVAWFSTRTYTTIEKRIVIAGSAVIVIGLVLVRWPIYAQTSANTQEYLAVAPQIAPRSTVLPLNFAPNGRTRDGGSIPQRYPLLLHTADYLGAEDKQLIILDNIGGLYPMFPYLWRSARDPYLHIQQNAGMERVPPDVSFMSYRERTGGTVDYVVTWGFDSTFEREPGGRAIREQLDKAYERVAASPNGMAVVYRRLLVERDFKVPVASVNELIEASLQLYQARKYEESILMAEAAVKIDPRSDRAYNNICAACNELGNWDRAIEACEKAIAINPANELAQRNLRWAKSKK